MAVGLTKFMGGARDLGSLSSAVQLPWHAERLIRAVGNGVGGAVVRLPELKSLIRRPGWPHFLILNEGSSSFDVTYFDSATVVSSVPAMSIISIGVDSEPDWAPSESTSPRIEPEESILEDLVLLGEGTLV